MNNPSYPYATWDVGNDDVPKGSLTPFTYPHHVNVLAGSGMGPALTGHCSPCPSTVCSWDKLQRYPCCKSQTELIRYIAQQQDYAILKCRYNPYATSGTSCHVEVLPKSDFCASHA